MSLNSNKDKSLRTIRNAIRFSVTPSENRRPQTSILKKKRKTQQEEGAKKRPKTGMPANVDVNADLLGPDFKNFTSIVNMLQIPSQNRTNKDVHVIQLHTSKLKFFDDLYKKDMVKNGQEAEKEHFSLKEFIEEGNLGMKRAMKVSEGLEDASARMQHIENSLNNVFLAHYQACKRFSLIEPFPNPGYIVFKHKDPSQNFFIVLEGRVGVLIKKKEAALKREIRDLRAVFDHLGTWSVDEETLSRYLNGVPLSDILDSNVDKSDSNGGKEKQGAGSDGRKTSSKAKSVSQRMVDNRTKEMKLPSASRVEISRAKTHKVPKVDTKESIKFNSLRSRKVRMPGSFLHGIRRIIDGRVHYKDEYIRENYAGLTIDQLLTGKINKTTKKVVLRKGDHLDDDEEWIDAGKIISQEADVS